jgi:hypothetical protein
MVNEATRMANDSKYQTAYDCSSQFQDKLKEIDRGYRNRLSAIGATLSLPENPAVAERASRNLSEMYLEDIDSYLSICEMEVRSAGIPKCEEYIKKTLRKDAENSRNEIRKRHELFVESIASPVKLGK